MCHCFFHTLYFYCYTPRPLRFAFTNSPLKSSKPPFFLSFSCIDPRNDKNLILYFPFSFKEVLWTIIS
ncbi:hypothetical protein Pfo_025066, partial [Paulownia fortunei]